MPTNNTPQLNGIWQPLIGEETEKLLGTFEHKKRLPKEVGQEVVATAATILGKGVDPKSKNINKTGLVVGYVQSGKTLSFTAVTALARDNGFPMVIVITGTKNNLLDQSTERLLEDLGVMDMPPRWLDIAEPKASNDFQLISEAITDWKCEDIPFSEKPTILVTIKKHHQALTNLAELLSQLCIEQPVLIIDDEADQASLNTRVKQGSLSSTYQRILELRNALPCHTYLQYTATPQAPLLINLIDTLSPSFVNVLEPGDGYVGGIDFFSNKSSYFVCTIPDNDVPSVNNELSETPNSLLEALRIFYLGVSAGRIEGRSPGNKNRSMLVHPSRTTYTHFGYYNTIKNVTSEWQRILTLPDNAPDKVSLTLDFNKSYQNLAKTVNNLPSFDNLWAMLSHTLRKTQIQEVNTRDKSKTPTIEWRKEYSWILVGGQALDRGFTIEGLTVTYMPRGIGTGNADTLQQRARFFGYKSAYLGYCRIFLENSTLNAFKAYVDHEEEMRKQLKSVSEKNITLSEWKRLFVLDPSLSPCRKNVLDNDYARGNFANKWFFPKFVFTPEETALYNNKVIAEFMESHAFIDNDIFKSDLASQNHTVATVSFEDVISELLIKYKIIHEDDTLNMTGLLIQLSRVIADARKNKRKELVPVFRMRPNAQSKRSIDNNGRINNQGALFQGRGKEPGHHLNYPGDTAFRDKDKLSLQIHFYDLIQNGVKVAEQMPIIAVWVPKRMGLDWISQNQT